MLIVLDATQPLNDEEHRLLAAVEGRPAIVAVNKSDLVTSDIDTSSSSNSDPQSMEELLRDSTKCQGTTGEPTQCVGRVPRMQQIRERASAPAGTGASLTIPTLATSALTGEGIATLREKILALATGGAASEPGLLTNLRQHQAVSTAISALNDAAKANAAGIPHEMILIDLYRALWALDALTGQTTSDDVLALIFSTFCIGK